MNKLAHSLFDMFANPFAHLSAENGEHRMAHVQPSELACPASEPSPLAFIVREDVGDADKRVEVFDVWHGNRILHSANTRGEAATWATSHGYVIPESL